MAKVIKEGKYLSPIIVCEQLKMMADSILCSLLGEIQSTPWFAVQVDEAADVSIHEQMCLTVKWVNDNYKINEDPIGLIEIPKTDALTLSSALKDDLIHCMLPVSQCREQTYMYDSAANMSGHL